MLVHQLEQAQMANDGRQFGVVEFPDDGRRARVQLAVGAVDDPPKGAPRRRHVPLVDDQFASAGIFNGRHVLRLLFELFR